MSEYQYYEFQAIDRPLIEADRQALRALSTRARITATSFTNSYEWGDLKGDPRELVERWFDLHLYLANWGTHRLILRLPKRLLDRSKLDVFLGEVDWVEIREAGENVIVDIWRDELEPDYDQWDEGSGWLAAVAPLRADVLSGDLRLFYLLWLAAVQQDLLADEQTEPLPGIAPLTGALTAFAEFFQIDPDLVQAAAERSAGPGDDATSADAVRDVLAAIPEREKTELLLRFLEGDPHLAAELKRKVRECSAAPAPAARTVGELRRRAEAIGLAHEQAEAERLEAERRRRAEEAEQARQARLTGVRRRGESVWREIEDEIEQRNAPAYDRAARLLFDLEVIASEQDTRADFVRRVAAIRERHARKGKLIERLAALKAS